MRRRYYYFVAVYSAQQPYRPNALSSMTICPAFRCLLLIAWLALPLLGTAQVPACQPVQIAPDEAKRDLLRQFITDCHREHYFFEDKGVVELIAYQDSKGRTAWYLSALIDDRYRDNPPAAYSMQGNDIVLVYHCIGVSR